jgi:hypothetical protein
MWVFWRNALFVDHIEYLIEDQYVNSKDITK